MPSNQKFPDSESKCMDEDMIQKIGFAMKKTSFQWMFISLMVAIATAIVGCTTYTTIGNVQDAKIYSSYDEKIPGKWAIIINGNSQMLDKTVQLYGWEGLYTFPLSFSSSFKSSIYSANDKIFSEVTEQLNIPSIEQMKSNNNVGYIEISPKKFEVLLVLQDKPQAYVDLQFDYLIKNSSNSTILSGYATGSCKSTGNENIYGNNRYASALDAAIQGAMRAALEEYGEKVSNSPRLRSITLTKHK